MISVLVVEDDTTKYGKIHSALVGAGIKSERISWNAAAAEALKTLSVQQFDLLLLDINIPRRLGEPVQRGVGLELLKDLRRDSTILLPRYIVGVTAYEDVIAEFGEQFADQLWTLVLYSDISDRWISRIVAKVQYISAAKKSNYFSDGKTYGIDLGIVCALNGVELSAIKNLPCDWQPLKLDHDETRYLSGTIHRDGKTFSVIAASAPRMGMSASAVLTSKMIAQFRPRILALTGICAGRAEKTNIGDIIVANPCWDWGSGKIDAVGDHPRFLPSPHQVELDQDIQERLREVCCDVALLAKIKESARGHKLKEELKIHFGPLASGAAVVANKDVFDGLLNQHRDLLGIEMEAYGVVVACKGSGKPRPTPIVIKSVCDFADKQKSDDHQEYAADTSALMVYHASLAIL